MSIDGSTALLRSVLTMLMGNVEMNAVTSPSESNDGPVADHAPNYGVSHRRVSSGAPNP